MLGTPPVDNLSFLLESITIMGNNFCSFIIITFASPQLDFQQFLI